MTNIERMLSDCGITYEVLPENDSLNKSAKSLRKKIIFNMLKEEKTFVFYDVVLLVGIALFLFLKEATALAIITIVFGIIAVAIQLTSFCINKKDVKDLYKKRAYYKLLTGERNTAELTKKIYDNVSQIVYRNINGKPYMKNCLYTSYLCDSPEVVLVTFGDGVDLSKVPMMFANIIRTHLPESQIQLRLTNRDTGEVYSTKIRQECSDDRTTCSFAINQYLKEGNYLIEIM